MHGDIVGFIANLLAVLLCAKLLAELAERLGQPAVLGELIGGVLLGTGLLPFFHAEDLVLSHMSEIGVLLLLFETGLHSDLRRLLDAGPTSTAVAAVGILAPFGLGWGLMTALGHGGMQAVFVGAALTATSVGITARVLSDMGRLSASESQIVLGAAVIDDVAGIVILSAVTGIAASGALRWGAIAKTACLSAVFIAAALTLGPYLADAWAGAARRMRVRGALVGAAFAFAMASSLAAYLLGTAMIVGAFCAGLLLARTQAKEDIDRTVRPLVDVFAPIFFVMVGAKVKLGAFNPLVAANRPMLGLAALLVIAAVAGKIASALAVRQKGLNRWAVGYGMVPRGEVGLIFAQIGLAAGIVDDGLYGAVVMMVVVTTFLAPPLLKRSLG